MEGSSRELPQHPISASIEFQSLLFGGLEDGEALEKAPPDFLTDLNLDGILDAIAAERPNYQLKPLLLTRLSRLETIEYRHEVFRDMAQPAVAGAFEAFAAGFRAARESLRLSSEVRSSSQRQRRFLEATVAYCDSVARLARDFETLAPASVGLQTLRQWLAGHVAEPSFQSLLEASARLKHELEAVRYTLRVEGNRVAVARSHGEADVTSQLLEAFQAFVDDTTMAQSFDFHESEFLNHVEEAVLDMVGRLNPGVFAKLAEHFSTHQNFPDPTLLRLDLEAQFYLAVLDHVRRFNARGVTCCLPLVTTEAGDVYAREAFDIGLANALAARGQAPIRNDFQLLGAERVLVVSGPNQGGKTTFARAFGQIHYLAALGCPVPAAEARLRIWDRMFTHFEREESALNPRSRLEGDLIRVRDILRAATPGSVVIFNEILSSMVWEDGLAIGSKILKQVLDIGCCCVFVTFHDELSSFNEATVGMVAQVELQDPTRRTFRVVRAPASGLAYAMAIAEKHALRYDDVKSRLGHAR